MTDTRMPTTLPSPVDRSDFQFVAVDATGSEWHWIDDEMIWVRVSGQAGADDQEAEGCDVLH